MADPTPTRAFPHDRKRIEVGQGKCQSLWWSAFIFRSEQRTHQAIRQIRFRFVADSLQAGSVNNRAMDLHRSHMDGSYSR